MGNLDSGQTPERLSLLRPRPGSFPSTSVTSPSGARRFPVGGRRSGMQGGFFAASPAPRGGETETKWSHTEEDSQWWDETVKLCQRCCCCCYRWDANGPSIGGGAHTGACARADIRAGCFAAGSGSGGAVEEEGWNGGVECRWEERPGDVRGGFATGVGGGFAR